MIDVHADTEAKVLFVTMSGKLTKQDYRPLLPAMEQLIRSGRPIRILLEMRDFHGWTVGALWEDLKFDFKHFSDIERLAMVGDKKWESYMATFCKPFTTAEVRYFDASGIAAARAWVGAASEPAGAVAAAR
jgi:SpoIIAA-like